MDETKISRAVSLSHIRVTDAFWEKEIGLVRDTVVPYQWEALNDRVTDAQPSYCMHNFKVAETLRRRAAQQADYVQPVYPADKFSAWPQDPAKPEERFYGFLFQDSDFSKWIEAAAYILQQYPDAQLEQTADEAIDTVCGAQHPDGYLDTFYLINDISKRFTNLRDHHELYCLGHLIEGAVAYYEATGKRKLLDAACRFADCVAEHLGTESGKLRGYPGHEIAEMALARLYEVTGEEKYRKLGLYFIEERGRRPYYFDGEGRPAPKPEEADNLRYQYQQAHLPVREQAEAVGHAVRATYLYSGMADFARISRDDSLKAACERLWEDVVRRKMYITGGVGATRAWESFSYAYDLPNDLAYAETCASVGMAFFARRMLELDPDARYADVLERELYNGVLSGMGLEGKSFFYVNPLEVVPEACLKDQRKDHVQTARQKWFDCACCPPNLARLVSSIGAYIYTETEETAFLHLYIGSRFEKQLPSGTATITVRSGFPWDGRVDIHVECDTADSFTIALRIPGWCGRYQLTGAEDAARKEEKGYLYLTKVWQSDSLQIEFPMEVRVMAADARVREDIGKAAVMRGPVVYCLEEADNGNNLHMLKMDGEAQFETIQAKISSVPVTAVKAAGWRQKTAETQDLYFPYTTPKYERTTLTWIPYYAWANRGEGEMQVWTRI